MKYNKLLSKVWENNPELSDELSYDIFYKIGRNPFKICESNIRNNTGYKMIFKGLFQISPSKEKLQRSGNRLNKLYENGLINKEDYISDINNCAELLMKSIDYV